MSQDHHWVGQPLVQDHPHQPDGEEDRAGDAVDVGRDHVDPGYKHQINHQSVVVTVGFDPTQRCLSSLRFGLDESGKHTGGCQHGENDQHQEYYL